MDILVMVHLMLALSCRQLNIDYDTINASVYFLGGYRFLDLSKFQKFILSERKKA